MANEKTETTNRLYKKTWVGDTLRYECITGRLISLNIGRASGAIRESALRYGFDVKLQRMFAVSATEFPTQKARAEEGARRAQEWIDHVYAGNDAWDLPTKGITRSVSRGDVEASIDRAYAGKGQVLFARKLDEITKAKPDLTPELAVIETGKFWLQTKQVASAWTQIQAERKAAAAASFGDADDEVERLLADNEG